MLRVLRGSAVEYRSIPSIDTHRHLGWHSIDAPWTSRYLRWVESRLINFRSIPDILSRTLGDYRPTVAELMNRISCRVCLSRVSIKTVSIDTRLWMPLVHMIPSFFKVYEFLALKLWELSVCQGVTLFMFIHTGKFLFYKQMGFSAQYN